MNGTIIAALLRANASLLALVSTDNIFPYVANEKTQLPFIMYEILGTPEYDKNGWVRDACSFNIFCLSNNYVVGSLIATQIRTALEFKETANYGRMLMTEFSESQDDNIFVTQQTFSTYVYQY